MKKIIPLIGLLFMGICIAGAFWVYADILTVRTEHLEKQLGICMTQRTTLKSDRSTLTAQIKDFEKQLETIPEVDQDTTQWKVGEGPTRQETETAVETRIKYTGSSSAALTACEEEALVFRHMLKNMERNFTKRGYDHLEQDLKICEDDLGRCVQNRMRSGTEVLKLNSFLPPDTPLP